MLVVAGTALATRAPDQRDAPPPLAASHEPEADDARRTASGEDLAHASDRLAAAGIRVQADRLGDLAARYGVGGAVRLFAWSHASGRQLDELVAMRDEGLGWGRIARELGVSPGVGRIMGNGDGREGAPGQSKDKARGGNTED